MRRETDRLDPREVASIIEQSERYWFPGALFLEGRWLKIRRIEGGTEQNPPEGPFVLQGPATDIEANKLRTSAAAFRRMLDAALQMTPGVVYGLNTGGAELKVTATGADVNVSVAAGYCFIRGTQATSQGMYHGYNDATKVINVLGPNPAHATLNRIDLVVARINDEQYSGAVSNISIEMVTGAPSGSPAVPAAPANSLILAQILIVAASATIPVSTDTTKWTERRVPAGRTPLVFDDQSATGATAQIVIPVPPGFHELRCGFKGRCDSAGVQAFSLQLNGDTGNNYDFSFLQDVNATLAGGGPSLAQPSLRVGVVPGTTGAAGAHGASDIRLTHADSTTMRKQLFYTDGGFDTDAAAGARIEIGQGQWRTANAPINSLRFFTTGNFLNWRTIMTGIPA